MTTKSATTQREIHGEPDVNRLVVWMTAAAWIFLGVGLVLSLLNLHHFSDRNTSLMVGFGCIVGSIHIYVMRTAIHLVHSRASNTEN